VTVDYPFDTYFPEVTVAEVPEIVKSLRNKKAPGPDSLPNRVLRISMS